MKPIIKLGLRIASLPIFDVKRNFTRIRRAEEALAKDDVSEAKEGDLDFHLIDHYLLSDDSAFEVPIRIFSPKKEKRNSIIIYFHGGGFVTGNLDTYTKACGSLAEKTASVVFAVDYRLAPEYPYPQGLADCYEIAKEICKHFHVHSTNEDSDDIQALLADETKAKESLPAEEAKQKIYLMGDSAGGNLATVVTRLLAERDQIFIDGEILLYPAMGYDYSEEFAASMVFPSLEENGYEYGLTLQKMRDYYDLYMKDTSRMKSDPNICPLLATNLKLLAPTLIMTAEFDPLRDEAKYYASRLRAIGVDCDYLEIKDAPHGFFTRRQTFPEAVEEVLDASLAFIERIEDA